MYECSHKILVKTFQNGSLITPLQYTANYIQSEIIIAKEVFFLKVLKDIIREKCIPIYYTQNIVTRKINSFIQPFDIQLVSILAKSFQFSHIVKFRPTPISMNIIALMRIWYSSLRKKNLMCITLSSVYIHLYRLSFCLYLHGFKIIKN